MADGVAPRRGARPRAESGDTVEPGAAPERRARLEIIRGDRYADWDAIYGDNVERLYRILYTKVGNRADAEDLTTETFLAVLPHLRESASVGEVRAYLLATARTVLAGHWRRTLGRELTQLDPEREAAESRPPAAAAPARAQAILAALPERYRRILELRFLESCTIRQAAAELGVSIANAKVLQHRALRRAAEVAAKLEG